MTIKQFASALEQCVSSVEQFALLFEQFALLFEQSALLFEQSALLFEQSVSGSNHQELDGSTEHSAIIAQANALSNDFWAENG